MRVPIQYAMTCARAPSPVRRLELAEWGQMHFAKPDDETFPCMRLCREAIRRGGLYPAAANAANEEANALFREGLIGFHGYPPPGGTGVDGSLPDGRGGRCPGARCRYYRTPGTGRNEDGVGEETRGFSDTGRTDRGGDLGSGSSWSMNLGHFIAAKCMGVKVTNFRHRHEGCPDSGKRRRSIPAPLPIGGILRYGRGGQPEAARSLPEQSGSPSDGASDCLPGPDPRAFNQKKVWRRMITSWPGR